MAENNVMRHGIRGLLFFGGLEIGYNIGGQTLSAPQTTELRVMGKEGGGAAEATLFKWVYMAVAKVLVFCSIVSMITRSFYPLAGGVVSVVDTYFSYKYAIRCGRKANGTGGGLAAGSEGSAAGYGSVRPRLR